MKTLFIDFGNVIGFFDHQRAVRQLVAYGPLTARELTEILYGDMIEEPFEAGQLTTEEYVHAAIRLGLLDCTPEQFLAAFVDIFTPNPEVCELIPKLASRYRLVLASNTNDAHFRKYCDEFRDVIQHFDELCPSHRVGWRKPHPNYFEHCQRVAQAEPHECLFIDDVAVNTEAATNHGWKTILYRPGNHLVSQLRDHGIELP